MTRDALELQIQDYLDGRMSDGDRGAFEKRMSGDAELAARVRDLRAISEAIRQDAPDLPPGFHTRLRARFEARHATARRWFRPMSWETAGLVAAVAVAAVLFVPVVLERQPGRPGSQVVFAPTENESRQNAPRDEVEEDRLEAIGSEALEEDADFAPVPEAVPEPVIEPETRRDEAAQAHPAPPPGARLKKQDAPALLQQAPTEPERAKRSRVEDKGAAEAPREAESTAASGRAAAKSAGDVKDELGALAQGKDGLDRRSVVAAGVALPVGVVEAGEMVEIRSVEQWDRLVPQHRRALGDAVGAYDPGSRLVLVGTPGIPVDCERSVAIAADQAYEIILEAATAAATGSDHGCAFRVPADERPVRIIEPTGDR